jgi:uncharacterized Zn finger protein
MDFDPQRIIKELDQQLENFIMSIESTKTIKVFNKEGSIVYSVAYKNDEQFPGIIDEAEKCGISKFQIDKIKTYKVIKEEYGWDIKSYISQVLRKSA